jgi:Dihydrodipicolinate synthetase family
VAQDDDLELTLAATADEQAKNGEQEPVQQRHQHDAQSEPTRPRSPAAGRTGTEFLYPTPTVLNGADTLTFAALAAGVEAVVWGAASIVPEQCVELDRLLVDDIDLPAARELWARMWPLLHFLETHSYSVAVKTACRLVGGDTGPVRAPLLPLTDDDIIQLAALVERVAEANAPSMS